MNNSGVDATLGSAGTPPTEAIAVPAPTTPLGQLRPHHLSMLRVDSAIADNVIAARRYRTVEVKADLRRLGFSVVQANVSALLLPVWSPRGEVEMYQLRPDMPRVRDGRIVKYETASGSRMTLDVNPLVRHILADPNVPLFVTEGIKKGDALVSRDCCSISLLGVWNWRGTNDAGGKTALADWEAIALNGRRVYIVFDSDVMLKLSVYQALARLKPFLESREANVALIYLPTGADGQKVGVDDYLASGYSVSDLLALATTKLQRPTVAEREDEGPYRTMSGGLVWRKRTKDGDIEIPLANFTAKIVADVAKDDGIEVRRCFEVEAVLSGRKARVNIPAARFAGMTWPTEALGAGAIVAPGLGLRDHCRAAIQWLSGDVPERSVYTHTGWRRVTDEWVYLHAGGAIGAGGPVPGVEVELTEPLQLYELPSPPSNDELKVAIRASLQLLKVAPLTITMPLFCAPFRAAMDQTDFSVHASGGTGVGKTELAALVQQFFGPGMDARHIPASWLSTGNSIESLAFEVKDAVLVVDDFAPAGTTNDVQRYHREADRLLRAQGNRAGRQRMNPDATLKTAKPPRGMILSPGEDVPRGQSLRSRVLVLEVSKEDIDWERLTRCQRDAADGLYAEATAGFVMWIAPTYGQLAADIREHREAFRTAAYRSGQHQRTPGIVAELAIGLHYFIEYAKASDAITHVEAEQLWHQGWTALGAAASAQDQHQQASEPAAHFLELLNAAIMSGTAHVAADDGSEPNRPEAYGWRQRKVGSGDFERLEWQPQGRRIGWIEGANLYLEPNAAYAAAQAIGRETGDVLTVSAQTLRKRLSEKGVLFSTDLKRQTITIRRTSEGRQRNVLHLSLAALSTHLEPDKPDKPDNSCQPAQLKGEMLGFADTSECGMSGFESQSDKCLKTQNGRFIADPATETSLLPSAGEGNVGFVGESVGNKTRRVNERRAVLGAPETVKRPDKETRQAEEDAVWPNEPDGNMEWEERI